MKKIINRKSLFIFLFALVIAGGFFLYQKFFPARNASHSDTGRPPSLQLYSLAPDQKTLTPPKTTFKAVEPVTFVLTFEKKPTSFWPFAKKAFAQENNQAITTQLFYNNTEAKDITVETKPLAENQFSFSLLRKNPSQLHPGKYQFKVTREADGQTQTLTQDFSWGVLAINPNKSIYLPGEIAKIGIGVLNDSGRTICNAAVTLEITDPDGIKTTLSEANKFINKSGYCKETSVTNIPDYLTGYRTGKPGIYKMHLSADNGNGVRSLDDSFEVLESIPFDIERSDFPMRIYPPAEYTGKITIKANQDFKGLVKEEVPEGFKISRISPIGQIRQTNPVQQIGWNVDWKKGQTYTLSYSIKFPQISPEFYLIGPLKLVGSDQSVLFQESRQWQIASDAVTTLFMESGTDATQGFEFYSSTANSPTSDTTLVKTGPRSIKIDSGAGNVAPYIRRTGVLADAGRRISAYFNFTNIPSTTNIRLFFVRTSAAGPIIGIRMTSAGVLQMANGTTQCGTVAGSTLSTGKWYRIAISYTITSTTSFTVKVYIDGVLDMTATGSDCTLANTSSDMLNIGWENAPGANKVFNVDNIYVDNGSDLTDPGDIRVTAKLPASDNAGNFDTAVGASPGAGSRYTNVNERALSTTNGWRQNATGQVSENFGIQAISAGDMDLSDQTLVAYGCWIYGAGSATDSGNAQITCNGTGSAINLTTTNTMYVSYVDTATYPTNAATIGMLSTGTTTDTILYEAGIQFAYIPTTISKVKFKGIQMQGIQVK